MKPVRRAFPDRRRIGGHQLPYAVGSPGGGRFEDAELGLGIEQRGGSLALLVEEGEQQHRKPVGVAGSGERPVLAHQRAHGVSVAARDGGDERVDTRVLAHPQRTIPQTRSATSLVKAATRKKARGLPGEVSEKATVPSSIRTR